MRVAAIILSLSLIGCIDAKVVDGENGVAYTKPAESDHNIDIGNYEFDLPRDHDQFGTAGFSNSDVLREFELNYRSSRNIEIPEATSARITIFTLGCTDYRELSRERQRYFTGARYVSGILPQMVRNYQLQSQGFTVANAREVVMDYVFEPAGRDRTCLVVQSILQKKSNRFHISKLGDFRTILETILGSIRRD